MWQDIRSDKKVWADVLQTMLQGNSKDVGVQKILGGIMRHDIVSDVLSIIKNGEDSGKTDVIVPASTLVKSILLVMQKNKMIGEFEYIDNGKGGLFRVQLLKAINECRAIRPRHAVKLSEYRKYEKRYLPAASCGFMIVSTSKGVMTHNEAIKLGVGGRLIAYVY